MKILLSIVTTVMVFTATCQSISRDWKLIKSVDGVKIYQAEADCEFNEVPDQKWYLLKIENTNPSPVTVEWDMGIWYNDKCVTCNDDTGENHHVVSVNARSFVAGECEIPGGDLYVFRDFIELKAPTKLTKYELQNIKVIIKK